MAHGDNGAFKNVNTSKENWISGWFGISGFSITCVANQNRTAVEIVLGKSSREANKSAYDYLYAKKDEIAGALGVQLNWWRFEGKSSYVDYGIDGVGIKDEANWLQMAKFHAEWSKKFFDIFVPLLKEWQSKQ